MKKEIIFKIGDRDFRIEAKNLEQRTFEVSSIPNPYKVSIINKEDPFEHIIELLNPKDVLIIDENVYKIYLQNKPLESTLDSNRLFILKASEQFKTLKGVEKILAFLEKNQFTKGEKLIVVGGGITEDVSGFVGAMYKRGIKWIFFPTTLLSMCDSCIGAKTGINYKDAKNQLALFYAPTEVFINVVFLQSLKQREILSGIGEILKLHIIGGHFFIEQYKALIKKGLKRDSESIQQLVLNALWIKKTVIEVDEFEKNERRALNYGHTFGHAIEVLVNYKIPHGQAIAIGMLIVNKLCEQRNLLKSTDAEVLDNLILDIIKAMKIPKFNTSDLHRLLKNDKKTIGNKTNFATIKNIGETMMVPIELDKDLYKTVDLIIENL